MTRLTPEQIKTMLQSMVLKDVAKDAVVDYTGLTRFVNGQVKHPRYEMITRLEKYLEDKFTIRAE